MFLEQKSEKKKIHFTPKNLKKKNFLGQNT